MLLGRRSLIAYQIEPLYPEHRCGQEQHKDDPGEPRPQLAVAIKCCSQKRGQCFAEQHTLRAQHAAVQGIADRQNLIPSVAQTSWSNRSAHNSWL